MLQPRQSVEPYLKSGRSGSHWWRLLIITTCDGFERPRRPHWRLRSTVFELQRLTCCSFLLHPSGTTESSLPTPGMLRSKRPGARAKACGPSRKKARVGSVSRLQPSLPTALSQLPALSEAEVCTVLQITAAGPRGCSCGCGAAPEGTRLQDQLEASPPSANTCARKRARVGSFSHDQLLPFSVIAALYIGE